MKCGGATCLAFALWLPCLAPLSCALVARQGPRDQAASAPSAVSQGQATLEAASGGGAHGVQQETAGAIDTAGPPVAETRAEADESTAAAAAEARAEAEKSKAVAGAVGAKAQKVAAGPKAAPSAGAARNASAAAGGRAEAASSKAAKADASKPASSTGLSDNPASWGTKTLASRLACFFRRCTDLDRIHMVGLRNITWGKFAHNDKVLQAYLGAATRLGGTCAVVSSSGVLQRHEHGSEIDQADTVIRFNDAPVAGFEKIVGSREDLRFVNMHFPELVLHRKTIKERDDVVYVGVLPSNERKFERLSAMRPGIKLYMADSQLSENVFEGLQRVFSDGWFHVGSDGFREWPSTGALGMLISLSICDEVRAYGMADTGRADTFTYPYHYYDPRGAADDNPVHKSFDAEKYLWRMLATNSHKDIDRTDVAIIPGFSQAKCS
mmetsp:Transcript_20716/g.57873  ORF Transcript_20716/g.57873 Transcript_20716/m.57873 type:complete len:439 (+) Transcript_20716:51-1367(+)